MCSSFVQLSNRRLYVIKANISSLGRLITSIKRFMVCRASRAYHYLDLRKCVTEIYR